MATQETYLLHLYRSRAVRGWQWAARLEHLGGESRRFSDPEALLAHLRAILLAAEPPAPPEDAAPATDEAATGVENGESQSC